MVPFLQVLLPVGEPRVILSPTLAGSEGVVHQRRPSRCHLSFLVGGGVVSAPDGDGPLPNHLHSPGDPTGRWNVVGGVGYGPAIVGRGEDRNCVETPTPVVTSESVTYSRTRGP